MKVQEKEMFDEMVENMKQLDRERLLMVFASSQTLLMQQQAEAARKDIPAA